MRKRLDFHIYDLAVRLFKRKRIDAMIKGLFAQFPRVPRLRTILEKNARRVFTYTHRREPTHEEIDSILSEMADLYGQGMVDFYNLHNNLMEYVEKPEVELLSALQGLLKGGRGVILVTPHFGDQSVIYFYLAHRGIELTVMINAAGQYQWLTDRLKNLHVIGVGEGAVRGLKALRNNEAVLLLGDMDYFPEGRTADFFGAPFPPPHGIARLALAARSPILPVYAVFRDGRYHIVNDTPILLDENSTQKDLEKRMLRSMESFIGRYPSHWFVFRDVWDLKANEEEMRRQLTTIMQSRRFLASWRNPRHDPGR